MILKWVIVNIRSIASGLTVVAVICTGYLTIDAPIPASRQYVVAQVEVLKDRIIDNALQTNKLQLDLLRKEQVDRQVQIKQEKNSSVRRIYQDRLDDLGENLQSTIGKKLELEQEKKTNK